MKLAPPWQQIILSPAKEQSRRQWSTTAVSKHPWMNSEKSKDKYSSLLYRDQPRAKVVSCNQQPPDSEDL